MALWSRAASVGSLQDSLGPSSTIQALWTTDDTTNLQVCWPSAFPCRWTFRAPTKHSCTSLLLLGAQTLDASQKTNPQKTLPEILWWCITSLHVVPGHLTGSTSSSTLSPKLGQHNTSSLPHAGS